MISVICVISLHIARFHIVTISLALIVKIVSTFYNPVMARLTLAFLDTFQVTLDSQPVSRFRSSKNAGLLVYLALQSDRPFLREVLATLFWPEESETNARNNLRQAVYQLRKVLGNLENPDEPYLLVTRQTVQFNADSDFTLDVNQFWQSIAIGDKEAAAAVYPGDLLPGFTCDSLLFEDWLRHEREQLHQAALEAMSEVTQGHLQAGRPDKAQVFARQQLLLEPWRELAHRQLMRAFALAGDRSRALAQYEQCREILWDELGIEPAAETVALYENIKSGDHGPIVLDESLVPSDEVRHNLPVPMTPFIGREQELAELTKLLVDTQVHIITILGPGGIGKTRLALEAAGRQRHPSSPFPDGVFFVSMAPVESANEILSTLAAALDLSYHPSGHNASSEREQILAYLARKNMLLIMDNFEHILEGRTLLLEISQQATKVKLLVTSQERLQMRGEQVFPIHGLEMPQLDGPKKDAATDYAAAQLFLNISRRTVPDFELLVGDAEQIHRICGLVEGMPLGLELAASWTGLMPLSDIAGEIEKSMQLLSTEHHDVPKRHRSIQATLDASWKRLTPEQKRAFQGVTIFRGGFTRSAAVEVAHADLSLLFALVNKSWLSYERKNDRYQIHELLRQYGSNKLRIETALEQEVRKRHSAHFCGYLKGRETDWFGARQQEAAAEVRLEIKNIQSAWRWAASQGDVRLLAQGHNSLGRFYSREMRIIDGREDFRSAANGLSNLLAQQEIDDSQSLTLLSQILAWQAHFADEPAQKQKILVQSQDILDRGSATGHDRRAEQAFIFLEQAYATKKQDYEASIRFSKLALGLFQALGDQAGEAQALMELGLNYRRLGRPLQAIGALRANLDIRQQLEDALGSADAMSWLGIALMYQQNLKEAEQLFRQALRLFRQLGSRYHEAATLMHLSWLQIHTGEILVARELVEQAKVLEREFGLPVNLWVHMASAACNIHLGRYAEAKAEVFYALDIAEQRGLSEETASGKLGLAWIAMAQEDLEGAKGYLQESLAISREAKDVDQFTPIGWLGYVARAQGDDLTARKHLKDVLRAVIEYDYTELNIWLPLASLLAVDDGRLERAIELYSLARRHIGSIKNSLFWQEVAGRELDDVRASLPSEVAAAAETKSRMLDVRETIDKILAELSRLPSA